MSSKPTLYHNPRCSKSRAALELVTERNIDTEVITYLDTPPDHATLSRILDMLGLEPRELMRTGETEYKDNNLADESLSREQLIDAMVNFPKLIERPILVNNGKAAIGRPLENIIAIL